MKLALAITLVALGPSLAGAQTPGGGAPAHAASFVDTCTYHAKAPRVAIEGTIKDPDGGVLLGATVSLECGAFRQDVRTGPDGTYRLTVPAGSYQIDVVALRGSSPGRRPSSWPSPVP